MKRLSAPNIRAIFAAILMVFVAATTLIQSVHADSWSWTSGVPITVSSKVAADDWSNACTVNSQGKTDIRKVLGIENRTRTTYTECMIGEGPNFQLFSTGSNLSVSFGGEDNAHIIRNIVCAPTTCVYMPNRDYLITTYYSQGLSGDKIIVYKNFVKGLQSGVLVLPNFVVETYYTSNKIGPDEVLSDPFNSSDITVTSKHIQRSPNDKWLVFELTGIGLFRMDMDTRQTIKFSDWRTNYWNAGPDIEFDITNDGQHIAVFGNNSKNTIYDITTNCGYAIPQNPTYSNLLNGEQTCPALYIVQENNTYMPNIYKALQPRFSRDGGEISFYGQAYNVTPDQPTRRIVLRALDYTAPTQLTYLALGDSYSSGEGDIERRADGSRYYLPGTNVTGDYSKGIPDEKCHISSRAYPFLISTSSNIPVDKMKSIACSGAKVADVSGWSSEFSDKNEYLGQWSNSYQAPRLKNIPTIAQLQTTALDNFTPGRVQQIEFVKRNKPRAITLTAGGNDVRFGDIVKVCVMKFGIGSTCDWSGSNQNDPKADSLEHLGAMIQGEYTVLRELYTQLHQASPDTKIYVLGYPQFVDSSTLICPTNFGLNQTERLMITNGVSYMNQVIRAAASAAGVYYVNIEESMSSHKLCGSDILHPYINGTVTAFFGTINPSTYEVQEAYHPKPRGHAAIYDTIKSGLNGQTIDSFEGCNQVVVCPSGANNTQPAIPAYFHPESTADKIIKATDFAQSTVKNINDSIANAIKGGKMNVHIPSFTFSSGSDVRIQIHSDPIDLGTFIASADGSLDAEITIPSNIPVGYHTLSFTGKTYSGESIKYLQIILVQGSSVIDIDEDGVADTNDKCLFITASGADVDKDGVDDACDPDLSDTPPTPTPTPTPTPSPSPSPSPTPSPTPNPAPTKQNIINTIFAIIVVVIKVVLSILQKILFKF